MISVRRFFAAALLLASFSFCAPAFADMLEVKGKGMLSGKVLSEGDGKVVFRNSWGETMTIPKNDVLFMQIENNRRVRRDDKSKKSGFSLEGIVKSVEGGHYVSALHDSAEIFFTSALDYFTGDAQDVADISKGAVRNLLSSSSKKFTAKNYGSGAGGIALVGLGLIAVAGFSFMLIFNAFEQGFLWGIALLATGLVFLSPVFGGALGVVLIIPYFLSAYFVVRYWEDSRIAVVGFLFSLNAVTLGYIILKGAFSWQ